MDNLANTLCALALEHSGKSLEVRIAAGLSQDIGIFRDEDGVSYVYHLTWIRQGKEIDFLLEVMSVIPNKRKDRKPKVEMMATRQFTQKGY